MIEFAVETGHENVEIGFQCAQMIERLRVDFVDHARVEVGWVNVLWPD